jgi:hypothetical protein
MAAKKRPVDLADMDGSTSAKPVDDMLPQNMGN